MQRTVRELLQQRRLHHLPTISENASLSEALHALDHYNTGLIVVTRNARVTGVFSERDFARQAAQLTHSLSLDQPLAAHINRQVAYVTPEYTLEECLAVMTELKVRHLLVMDEKRLIALVGMHHIVEAVLEDKKFLIDELVKYITGSPFAQKLTPQPFKPRGARVMSIRSLHLAPAASD